MTALRQKPILFLSKVSLILFSLFLSLAVLEILLRVCGFGYKIFNPLPKASGADYRILCVGESTTTGTGAADESTGNYPKQLEALLLSAFPDKKIQCFFDRTIGWNSSEILLKFPVYIKKYNPNMIILMVGVNNWWNMERSNILLFSKNNRVSDISFRVMMFLDNFRVWKLIKWIRFSLGNYKPRWGYWTPESEKINEAIKRDGNEVMMLFNKLAMHDIVEMVKIAQANSIKVIIADYPMGAYGGLGSIQKSIALKYKIPFVDNETVFKNLKEVDKYLWKDGWHPNEKGYAIVAKNFYDCIVDHRLIN